MAFYEKHTEMRQAWHWYYEKFIGREMISYGRFDLVFETLDDAMLCYLRFR